MIRDLPCYETYETAGAWIAEIPCGWGWEPARTIFAERKETGLLDEQMLSVTIARGVIPQSDLIASTSKKDSSNTDKSKYKLVEPGDVVYNKMRAWQGAAGSSQYRGIVSPAYIVMTPRAALSKYLHYLVRTPMFAKEAERWSYGITSDQWSLRPEHFKMIRFPLPPPEEQAAIVKYLVHANVRIDKAIATKRRLIALLEEQSSGIRDQVLRSGDWPRRRLKTLLDRVDQGVSPQAENQEPGPGEWGVLKSGCVNGGSFRADQVKRLPDGFAIPKALSIREGDLLVSRANGSPHLVGSAARVSGMKHRAILSDKTFRLVTSPTVDADFLAMSMNAQAYRQQVRTAISGAEGLANNLPLSALKSFEFALPPLQVQRELVRAAGEETSRLRLTMSRVTRELALLQEFRTRLVADVVTGQVDVRAIAATLPDASEVTGEAFEENLPLLDEELVDAVEGDDE